MDSAEQAGRPETRQQSQQEQQQQQQHQHPFGVSSQHSGLGGARAREMADSRWGAGPGEQHNQMFSNPDFGCAPRVEETGRDDRPNLVTGALPGRSMGASGGASSVTTAWLPASRAEASNADAPARPRLLGSTR